jgi:hypothetical protein
MAIRPVSGVADIRRCAPILVAAFNESPFTTRWTTKSAIARLTEVYKSGKDYCFLDVRKEVLSDSSSARPKSGIKEHTSPSNTSSSTKPHARKASDRNCSNEQNAKLRSVVS